MTAAIPSGHTEPHVEAAPKEARYFAHLGFGVAAIVFGVLIAWSLLAPIDGAVIAGGQVVVEGNRKTIQHLEGGVVAEIFVREGDLVEENTVLLRLDNKAQSANLALIDGQLAELYARRARLGAERDNLEGMSAPVGETAVLSRPDFAEKLRGQTALFEARRTTRKTQADLLQQSIIQQQERIAGLQAQIASLRDQLSLIKDELSGVRALYEQGFAPKTRLRALEREAKRLGGEQGALRAGVAEAESLIAEAKLESERLFEVSREEAIAGLREAAVSIAELEERRVTAADMLTRTKITAPQAGRVLQLAVHTIGGVVGPGAPLLDIVPAEQALMIASRIDPQDVDKVAPGQATRVRFSAFGGRQTPEADGVVKTVSADSMTDEITGAPFYLVLIEMPDTEEISTVLRGQRLVPGMPVEAYIRTGSQPAISYLLKPLTDSMTRALREE